ncbi:MAG TPA: demethylmenaquinone methyltransferase [Streptosporangiaceae bacterium]|nr:demethylmenaquinone methyltransferase [Streptosporangiaceae bacterium]
MVRAHLDKRPGEVSAMFDRVADRYDLLNDVLSLGMDRRWRRVVAAAVGAGPRDRVLDLAAGTGASSRALTGAGAACVACDFSLGMLRVGAHRPPGDGPGTVGFVAGDALRLPFADGVFDAVTISFGLRNVTDPAAALAEMRRVTRPGGRLVVCEFGHLKVRALDALYDWALAVALPSVARTLSRNTAAYAYLAESIKAWPDGQQLAGQIREAGWSAVRWRRLTMGVVAVHLAINPPADGREAGQTV